MVTGENTYTSLSFQHRLGYLPAAYCCIQHRLGYLLVHCLWFVEYGVGFVIWLGLFGWVELIQVVEFIQVVELSQVVEPGS